MKILILLVIILGVLLLMGHSLEAFESGDGLSFDEKAKKPHKNAQLIKTALFSNIISTHSSHSSSSYPLH